MAEPTEADKDMAADEADALLSRFGSQLLNAPDWREEIAGAFAVALAVAHEEGERIGAERERRACLGIAQRMGVPHHYSELVREGGCIACRIIADAIAARGGPMGEPPEGKRKAFWRAYRAQRHALGLPRHAGPRSPRRERKAS